MLRRLTGLFVTGALIFAPILIEQVAATSPSIKEGDKCTKVKATTRSSSGVNLTCRRFGTTKILKWKRTVTKRATTTVTTIPTVTTASQISIKNFAFTVASNVKSTDVVSVTNHDSSPHTMTSDTGIFDVTIVGGATRSLPSLKAGTYAFFCAIHTSMRGTLRIG